MLHANRHLFRWMHPHLLVDDCHHALDGRAFVYSDTHVSVKAVHAGAVACTGCPRCLSLVDSAAGEPGAKRQQQPQAASPVVPAADNVAPVFTRRLDGSYVPVVPLPHPVLPPPSLLAYVCFCVDGAAFVVVDLPHPSFVSVVCAHPSIRFASGVWGAGFSLYWRNLICCRNRSSPIAHAAAWRRTLDH
jgi:hypothetical protein